MQEEVKQVVFDDYIQRIPIQQTIDKIHKKMNVKLGENWICKLRARIKKSARQEIPIYQTDRYAYVQKYLDRIHAVEQLEKKSWHLLRRNEEEKKDDLITLKYIGELREIEVLLTDLYHNLPLVINAVGGFIVCTIKEMKPRLENLNTIPITENSDSLANRIKNSA